MSEPDWQVPLTTVEVSEPDVQAVMECLESGWLTMGPRTRAFEEQLGQFVGTPHAVTVSSGTAALHLACLAAGIGIDVDPQEAAFWLFVAASAGQPLAIRLLSDVVELDPDLVGLQFTVQQYLKLVAKERSPHGLH